MSMTDSLDTLERMVLESGDAALAQDWQEIRYWYEIPEAHTTGDSDFPELWKTIMQLRRRVLDAGGTLDADEREQLEYFEKTGHS
jgi:hypothetical protein